eukprot:7385852-Prymnesium_polylepis.2
MFTGSRPCSSVAWRVTFSPATRAPALPSPLRHPTACLWHAASIGQQTHASQVARQHNTNSPSMAPSATSECVHPSCCARPSGDQALGSR